MCLYRPAACVAFFCGSAYTNRAMTHNHYTDPQTVGYTADLTPVIRIDPLTTCTDPAETDPAEVDPFGSVMPSQTLRYLDKASSDELAAIAKDDGISVYERVELYLQTYAIGLQYKEGDKRYPWVYETARYDSTIDAISVAAKAADNVCYRIGYAEDCGYYAESSDMPGDAKPLNNLGNPNRKDGAAPFKYPVCSVRASRRFVFSRSAYLLADGALLRVYREPLGTLYYYEVWQSDELSTLDACMRIVPDDVAYLAGLTQDSPTDANRELLAVAVCGLSDPIRSALAVLYPQAMAGMP